MYKYPKIGNFTQSILNTLYKYTVGRYSFDHIISNFKHFKQDYLISKDFRDLEPKIILFHSHYTSILSNCCDLYSFIYISREMRGQVLQSNLSWSYCFFAEKVGYVYRYFKMLLAYVYWILNINTWHNFKLLYIFN